MADTSQADKAKTRPKLFRQYFASFTVCLGGFHIGNIIGWSSAASAMLSDFDESFAWIVSVMALGGACGQILTGLLMEFAGRKITLIVLISFTLATWICVYILSLSAVFLICLRFFHGFFAGGFCMVCPMLIGEIAHKASRGFLGACFQAFVAMGILFSYFFCLTRDFMLFSILSACPCVLDLLYLTVKESPVYLMKFGKREEAEESLAFYRGKSYDASAEMEEIVQLTKETELSFFASLRQKGSVKAIVALIGMQCIQQICGINAVIFYALEILQTSSGSESRGCRQLIILGVDQVVFTFVAAVLADRVGRRVLWFVSLAIMSSTLFACGLYFQFNTDSDSLPAICLVYIYVAGYSLGAGPLPWAMLGELIPMRVKGPTAACVVMVNWLMAFMVTMSFDDCLDFFGASAMIYGFGVLTLSGVFFVLFCVIETKGKSLKEIQDELQFGKIRPTISGK